MISIPKVYPGKLGECINVSWEYKLFKFNQLMFTDNYFMYLPQIVPLVVVNKSTQALTARNRLILHQPDLILGTHVMKNLRKLLNMATKGAERPNNSYIPVGAPMSFSLSLFLSSLFHLLSVSLYFLSLSSSSLRVWMRVFVPI